MASPGALQHNDPYADPARLADIKFIAGFHPNPLVRVTALLRLPKFWERRRQQLEQARVQ